MSKRQLLIATVLLLLVSIISCNKKSESGYSVQQGSFVQSVTETGELAAVNARSFAMQRYGRYWYEMKLIGLLKHGSEVKEGDSLFQFDPSDVKKYIIDRETDLETQLASLEKIIVQNENRVSELNSALLTEQASYNLKKLELEQFRFESDKSKKIKELEFKQAQLSLEKVKRSIELNEIISKNDLRIQELRVARVNNDVKNAYLVLPQLTVRTPIPGIFQVAKKRNTNELIQVGNSIYFGSVIGSVPDLRWMKVNTIINEADFMKVKVGNKVNVRLDALPQVVFKGEITFIGKLCHPIDYNSRQKVFDVEVKMLESDQRLKPGMTVSCEFLCDELEDVFYVPLSCVETIDSKNYIYIDKGVKTERVEVIAGPSDNATIVIKGNVTKGQKLIPANEMTIKTNS